VTRVDGGRVFVRDLVKYPGKRVVVYGWLQGLRRARSAVRFLAVRDRTGTVQAVYRDDGPADLTPESAIRVTGTVRPCGDARFGTVEIDVEALDLVAAAAPSPLSGRAGPEARLDHRYLDLRGRDRVLVFDVQTTLEAAVRDFLRARDFLEIHSPKITAGGSESGAAVFELSYFGQRACLVQSPQFYVQMAMAAGFDRVFEVGPVFRAEPAVTNRHATEFTGIDVELSWIDSHEDLITFEEQLLSHALSVVREVHGADIERYCGVSVEVPAAIPRLAYPAALALAAGLGDGQSGGRLSHEAEQHLCRYARERTGRSFVFVTGYPAADRPFYTMREEPCPDTAQPTGSRSFDLLWRGIEITSGCQREHRYDRLMGQIADADLGSAALEGYLENYYCTMFRHGCPPHGGFGIGLNRLLMALLGQPSIRDTSFVYRGPGRFVP
jgi:aspartyl-tRNA synthetase